MRKRFVVLLSAAPKSANDRFLEWARNEQISWWHWMQGSWLLVDSKGEHTAATIRDGVGQSFGKIRCLVLELRGEDDSWAGRGPRTVKRNMFSWIKSKWKKES
jgi:hypothetical protein